MLPTVIYLLEAIRRALKKSGRGMFMLVDVFGEAGRHTRSAVGLAELPFGIAVEIELIARVRP